MADRLLLLGLRSSAALCAGLVLLIALFVLREALPALAHVGPLRFFSDAGWYPNSSAAQGQFNLVPMVVGSVLAMLGALLLAGPLGVLSALFCHCGAPEWLANGYRRLLELLAGIPSVVYGFWGLVVLVPKIQQWQPPGTSLLAGILVVALMIVPTVALTADAALRAVPLATRRAAAALGMGGWATGSRVLLPAARSGVFTGLVLAAGRALGETLAMLMVCGNVVQLPHSLFDPVRTLTVNIALEMAYATGDQRSALFVTGLVLLLLIAALMLVAEKARSAQGASYG